MQKTYPVRPSLARLAIVMSAASLGIGCESGDQRLADYAARATEQQARQNEHLAEQSNAVIRQSEQLAAAARELVEQDAAARRELISSQDNLQHDLQFERARLDHQRGELDRERRAVAAAAIREPFIAQAVTTIGLIMAALLPLVVTAYALHRLPQPAPGEELLLKTMLESVSSANLPRVFTESASADGGTRLAGPPTAETTSINGPDAGATN